MKSFTISSQILLISFVIISLCSYQSAAQSSSLFAGYKGLPWGSSLSDIQTLFSSLQDLGKSEDSLLHIYMQKTPLDGVDNRLFYFWNDRLVQVRLFYNHEFVTKMGGEEFIGKMISGFGSPASRKLKQNVKDEDNQGWDILTVTWQDANTSITFESKQSRASANKGFHKLEFQSLKLFKEIKGGGGGGQSERDWGW
jgi:hypothetical protein